MLPLQSPQSPWLSLALFKLRFSYYWEDQAYEQLNPLDVEALAPVVDCDLLCAGVSSQSPALYSSYCLFEVESENPPPPPPPPPPLELDP